MLDGGLDADTMVGLGGNDTYIVDDVADVVVEAAGAGTDTVETEMAAFSLELIANVENLNYTGIDADPFVGTGNALNNVISGGDLNDTLSGLGGNDTLKAASTRSLAAVTARRHAQRRRRQRHADRRHRQRRARWRRGPTP